MSSAACMITASLFACCAAATAVTTSRSAANCSSLLSVKATYHAVMQDEAGGGRSGQRQSANETGPVMHNGVDISLGFTLPHTVPVIAVFLLFAGYCVWYELRYPAKDKDQGNDSKPRIPLWDVMRFIIEYFIVFGHVGLQPWFFLPPETQLFMKIEGYGGCFRMASFAFISGVFGSNITSQALSRMICYTLGTAFITTIVMCATGMLHNMIEPVFNVTWSSDHLFSGQLWYLVDLFIWRLTISPLFYIMHKRMGMPSFIPFLSCILFMYAGRHLHTPTAPVQDSGLWTALQVLDSGDGVLYYGNFFALGVMIGPNSSAKAFLDARLFIVAVLVVVSAYHYCWDIVQAGAHNPITINDGPIGMHSFVTDLKYLAVVSSFVLAALTCIAQIAALFTKLAPSFTDFIAGCGSRTLYAYVLQFLVLRELGLQQLILNLPSEFAQNSFMLIATFVLNVILSSRGCESLFRWWVMPYWILDIVDSVFKKETPDILGPQSGDLQDHKVDGKVEEHSVRP